VVLSFAGLRLILDWTIFSKKVWEGSFGGELRENGSEFGGFFSGISQLYGVFPYLVFFGLGAFAFFPAWLVARF